MRTLVESQITFPAWAHGDERYKRLDVLDRWIDGTIYNHLKRAFPKETDPNGRYIPIEHRRPSTRWNLAKMLSKMVARKLFAGRHVPILAHPRPEVHSKLLKLAREAKLARNMLQTATWGSVGAVAVTFKIVVPQGSNKPRMLTTVYRARQCTPVFDECEELKILRVHYPISGKWWIQHGFSRDADGDEISTKKNYWFIRDFTKTAEITYQPLSEIKSKWSPQQFVSDKLKPILEGEMAPVQHDLGFVPAHWFVNLSGGEFPDGDCTFEPALNNVVDIDYTLSMIGMGIRYSACPQLVLQGEPINSQMDVGSGGVIYRGPTRYLQFGSTVKSKETGTETGGGDAHLLEPTGQGMQVGIREYVMRLKQDALEQICASRKDPQKVTTAMSGRGMELIEEEFLDLVEELRTQYGEEGYLPLLKRMGAAAIKAGHPLMQGVAEEELEDLVLGWPAIHEMDTQDYLQLVQGISQAKEGGIIDDQQASDFYRARVDVPVGEAPRQATGTRSSTAEE